MSRIIFILIGGSETNEYALGREDVLPGTSCIGMALPSLLTTPETAGAKFLKENWVVPGIRRKN
jgi:hypothetical protein